MERRAKERRANIINPVFPLLTVFGRIMDDRRKQPDRRLNNIQVKFLAEVQWKYQNYEQTCHG